MVLSMEDLMKLNCQPLTRDDPALEPDSILEYLETLEGWQANEAMDAISREYRFSDYYHTMGFVNAAAWVAHTQDHHPDMHTGYNRCTVTYSTHSVGGLSLNDFICAARTNALFQENP